MKGSEIFEPRGWEIYLEIRPVHKRLVKYKRTKRLRNLPPPSLVMGCTERL